MIVCLRTFEETILLVVCLQMVLCLLGGVLCSHAHVEKVLTSRGAFQPLLRYSMQENKCFSAHFDPSVCEVVVGVLPTTGLMLIGSRPLGLFTGES